MCLDRFVVLFCVASKLSDASLNHLISALCQLSLDGVSSSPTRVSTLSFPLVYLLLPWNLHLSHENDYFCNIHIHIHTLTTV